ncbi:MAG: ROK family protein [Bacteroidota bacterium]
MSQLDVVVGIDIGGTFTKFGVVDRAGNMYIDDSVSTEAHDNAEDFIASLYDKIMKDIKATGISFNLRGVGIGAPNGNYYNGKIEFAPNLKWKGVVELAAIVRKQFGIPAVLTNDANAAALGEMIYGGAKGMKNFVMITLGTGLGSGIVVNGDLVYGHDGFAGELGHVVVTVGGRQCACTKRGCLETYVSANGIKRTVFKLLGEEISPSRFRDRTFNELEPKDITRAANEGDPIAIRAYEYTGELLGRSLSNTVAHTSPEAIFLFGGLALAGKWIFEPTKKAMEENLLPIFRNKIKILPSALLDKNIAVMGSAALMWKELEKQP